MDKRYRILSGQSKRDVRDVDPGTREYRTSELVALCDRDALPPQIAGAGGPAAVVAPGPGLMLAASASVASRSICVPGSTQACVGPGGCSGGQACRADGAGFGVCDCGPSRGATSDAGP